MATTRKWIRTLIEKTAARMPSNTAQEIKDVVDPQLIAKGYENELPFLRTYQQFIKPVREAVKEAYENPDMSWKEDRFSLGSLTSKGVHVPASALNALLSVSLQSHFYAIKFSNRTAIWVIRLSELLTMAPTRNPNTKYGLDSWIRDEVFNEELIWRFRATAELYSDEEWWAELTNDKFDTTALDLEITLDAAKWRTGHLPKDFPSQFDILRDLVIEDPPLFPQTEHLGSPNKMMTSSRPKGTDDWEELPWLGEFSGRSRHTIADVGDGGVVVDGITEAIGHAITRSKDNTTGHHWSDEFSYGRHGFALNVHRHSSGETYEDGELIDERVLPLGVFLGLRVLANNYYRWSSLSLDAQADCVDRLNELLERGDRGRGLTAYEVMDEFSVDGRLYVPDPYDEDQGSPI